MLPRENRLRHPADFARVSRRGRRGAAGSVVIHLVQGDPHQATRVGFVVSKKVGNSVIRHRVVRRLRGIWRDTMTHLEPGTSAVVRALPAAATASSAQLADDIRRALEASARRRR